MAGDSLKFSAVRASVKCELLLRQPGKDWFCFAYAEPNFGFVLPQIIAGEGPEVVLKQIGNDSYRILPPAGKDCFWFNFEVDSNESCSVITYPISELRYGPTLGPEATFTLQRAESKAFTASHELKVAEKHLHKLILHRVNKTITHTKNSIVTYWSDDDTTTTQADLEEGIYESVMWFNRLRRMAEKTLVGNRNDLRCQWCDWLECPDRLMDRREGDRDTPALKILSSGKATF